MIEITKIELLADLHFATQYVIYENSKISTPKFMLENALRNVEEARKKLIIEINKIHDTDNSATR